MHPHFLYLVKLVTVHVCGLLGSVPVELVVDTGSAVPLLREDVWTRLCMNGTQCKLQQWTGKTLASVNGTLLSVKVAYLHLVDMTPTQW